MDLTPAVLAAVQEFQSPPSAEREAQTQQLQQELLQICQSCSQNLSLPPGELRRVGAYQLGVQKEDSELDLIYVVVPEGALSQLLTAVEQHLRQVLQLRLEGTDSSLCFELKGQAVRLLLAQDLQGEVALSMASLGEQEPQTDAAQSMAALQAEKAGQQILASVPNVEDFRKLLRVVRHWAQQRGLYGSLFGFFSGSAWAVCCARVCQAHPGQEVGLLLCHFFQDLCRWDWSKPVSVLPTETAGRLSVMLGAGGRVSESAMRALQKELRRGLKEVKEQRITELLAQHNFFRRYRQYIRLDFIGTTEEISQRWWAWGHQQLPELVLLLESMMDGKVTLRPWPQWLPFKDEKWPHAKAVFVGLHVQRTEEQKSTLDLREIMVKFLEKISAWPDAERFANHFDLLVRAVNHKEVQQWLAQQGLENVTVEKGSSGSGCEEIQVLQ